MGGFFRFLLGGALGAAVGILISQKRSSPSRTEDPPMPRARPTPVPWHAPAPADCAPPVTAPPPPTPAAPPAPPVVPPAAPTAAAPAFVPTTPAFVPTTPSAVPAATPVEEPPPAAVYEVPPPGALEDFPLRVAAMSALITETPVERPPAPPPVEEAAAEAAAGAVPHVTAETAEAAVAEMPPVPEIVFTPEILEGPVPGVGWEPSSGLFEDEESYEEFLPVVPDEFQPYEAPEVERPSAPAAPQWGAPVVAESGPAPEAQPAQVPVTPPAAAAAVTAQDVVAAASPGPVVEVLAGDDLRARIEATRRRIREELEQPFAKMKEIDLAEPPYPVEAMRPEPVGPSVPGAVIGEPMATGPVVGAAPGPAIRPAPGPAVSVSVAAGTAQSAHASAVPAPPSVAAATPEAAPALGHEDGVGPEYEAMRARIEMTRSRLKAKAFDAMMAGESALLGRDPAGAKVPPATIGGYDGEIEHKVETTLREQAD